MMIIAGVTNNETGSYLLQAYLNHLHTYPIVAISRMFWLVEYLLRSLNHAGSAGCMVHEAMYKYTHTFYFSSYQSSIYRVSVGIVRQETVSN